MFEGRNKKIILAVVIVLVIAAISTLIYFIVDFNKVPNNNGEASDTEREGETGGTVKKKKKTNEVSTSDTPLADLKFENNASNNQNGNTSKQLETFNGYPVAGYIKIPKISIDLPVLADSSKEAIELSVAVEVTSAGLNKVGNTTIIGHNYRDGKLFSNNKDLINGDKIYITDNKGTTVEYIIYNTYITKRSDSDYLVRDTGGRREITLTTCTDDTNTTQNINVIWAKENI